MSRRRGCALALLAGLLGCAVVLPSAPGAEPRPQRGHGERAAEAPAQRRRQRARGRREKRKRRHGRRQPGGLDVKARAWILVDARTGAVLLAHRPNRRLPIASTTKLMTAYVVLEDLPLNRIVTAQPYHPEYGESLMGLRAGERISVRDLLYGLILLSGNDAAHTLAVAAAGSQPRFVRQMNRYAAALGLSHTHYANPVGLDQRGNYSSAGDLAALTRHLLRIPAFARISDSRQAVLTSVRPRRRIESINELLFLAPWVTGVKTGHTFGALYVLVGSGRRKGVELISDAIGAPSDEDRFDDNLELLEYGFRQYRVRRPIRAGEDLADPSIRYAGGELPLRAGRGVAVGVRRGQQLAVTVRAPEQVEGPIRRGQALGRATVVLDGMPSGSVVLRAGRALPRASLLDRARAFVEEHPIPIAAAAFVILMGGVLLLRWLYRRRKKGPG
jgi:serine-type D-Ala-D-Ala carboxypeptidase (penicillin-binding protein 5/6)